MNESKDMNEQDKQSAIKEFRHAATKFVPDPNKGTRYALDMAAAECQLLGIDPSTIEPEAE